MSAPAALRGQQHRVPSTDGAAPLPELSTRRRPRAVAAIRAIAVIFAAAMMAGMRARRGCP